MSKYYHSLARPQSGSGPAVSHSESTSSNNSTSLYAHPASFRSLATSSAAEDPKHLSGSSSFLGSHTAGPSTSTSTSSNSHSHPNTASSSRLPSQRQGPFPGLLSDPPPAPYSFHQQTASPTTATNDFFAHQQQQHQHQQSARHTAHFQVDAPSPSNRGSSIPSFLSPADMICKRTRAKLTSSSVDLGPATHIVLFCRQRQQQHTLQLSLPNSSSSTPSLCSRSHEPCCRASGRQRSISLSSPSSSSPGSSPACIDLQSPVQQPAAAAPPSSPRLRLRPLQSGLGQPAPAGGPTHAVQRLPPPDLTQIPRPYGLGALAAPCFG